MLFNLIDASFDSTGEAVTQWLNYTVTTTTVDNNVLYHNNMILLLLLSPLQWAYFHACVNILVDTVTPHTPTGEKSQTLRFPSQTASTLHINPSIPLRCTTTLTPCWLQSLTTEQFKWPLRGIVVVALQRASSWHEGLRGHALKLLVVPSTAAPDQPPITAQCQKLSCWNDAGCSLSHVKWHWKLWNRSNPNEYRS